MAVGPGAAAAGGFLSVQSLTWGGSMTCGWGFVLPAGGHWVENGSGVQGKACSVPWGAWGRNLRWMLKQNFFCW